MHENNENFFGTVAITILRKQGAAPDVVEHVAACAVCSSKLSGIVKVIGFPNDCFVSFTIDRGFYYVEEESLLKVPIHGVALLSGAGSCQF